MPTENKSRSRIATYVPISEQIAKTVISQNSKVQEPIVRQIILKEQMNVIPRLQIEKIKRLENDSEYESETPNYSNLKMTVTQEGKFSLLYL